MYSLVSPAAALLLEDLDLDVRHPAVDVVACGCASPGYVFARLACGCASPGYVFARLACGCASPG